MIGCHALRHTYGTQLVVTMLVPLPVAQRLLGHRSIETTMRYMHVPDRALRAAVDEYGKTWQLFGNAGSGDAN
jgi:integrase